MLIKIFNFTMTTLTIFLLMANAYAATGISNLSQGEHYKINNNNIYAVTFGNGPNIIFESGLGGDLSSWEKIAPSVAEHAHVVLYDRAGNGKSNIDIHPQKTRTAKDAVNDLLALLENLHIKPPYILVGHSAGGLYMQYFARKYPEKIAGVVLVDSASPFQKMHDSLPDKSVSYYYEAIGLETSEKEVREAKPFPNIPLIVLSATIHGPKAGKLNSKANQEQWAILQEGMSKMSDRSQHITANNTDHLMQKEKPWLVIAAINEMIKQVNKDTK